MTELLHVPFEVQVCTPLPDDEHRVAPGVQVPWQAPLTHAWFVQATAADQPPVGLQVSTPLPEHRVAPGVQTPEHAPLTHAWFVQETVAPQLPVASHVWVPALPEHCTAPGEQTPVQAPPTQA